MRERGREREGREYGEREREAERDWREKTPVASTDGYRGGEREDARGYGRDEWKVGREANSEAARGVEARYA